MKKLLFLIPVFVFAINILSAQDDELPPPTNKPKSKEQEAAQTPDDKDFKGFKKQGKMDLSKFILEPDFTLSIAANMIDIGFSPLVGYRVTPRKKESNGNTGLFAGGEIVYRYTGYSGIAITNSQNGQILGSAKAHFHTYGGGVFLQYNIWRGLFARAKFELVHRDMADLNSSPIAKNPNNLNEGFYFARIQKTIPACLIGVGYNLLQSKNIFVPILVSYDVLHSAVNKNYTLYPRGFTVQLGFITLF